MQAPTHKVSLLGGQTRLKTGEIEGEQKQAPTHARTHLRLGAAVGHKVDDHGLVGHCLDQLEQAEVVSLAVGVIARVAGRKKGREMMFGLQ